MFSLMDVQHALRLLRKTPKFTVAVIVILTGGLAISLFTFQFVYALMYKDLPLPDGQNLYRAGMYWQGEATGSTRYFPAWEFAQIRDQIQGVAETGIWQNKTLHVSLGENTKVVAGVRTEASVLQTAGVQPLKGRLLFNTDSEPGQAPVVVISYSIWQSLFGGVDDIVGKVLYVSGMPHEVVGVMPAEFLFPISHQLWLPIDHRLLNPVISSTENVEAFVRLKPGVSREQAENTMFRLTQQAFSERQEQFPGVELSRAHLRTFVDYDISEMIRNFLLALNLIALFILLLACINTSNLLFARAIQRGKESAIRLAIGASRKRLIMQLMWEGLIFTLVSAVLAVIVTAIALNQFHNSMHSMMQGELAFWYVWQFDIATALATLVFIAFVVFVACYMPARRAASQDINSALRDGTRGAQGRAVGRASRILVTLQIVLITVIALIGSVIAFKVDKIVDMDIGLTPNNTYFTMLDLPSHNYENDVQWAQFYERLRQRVNSQPEIVSSYVQFDYGRLPFEIDGVEYQTDGDRPKGRTFSVIGSMDFTGPRLLEGREISDRDGMENQLTAMISSSMAKRHWPGESALDKRFSVTLGEVKETYTVVGVMSDVSQNPFRAPDQRDEFYLSGYQKLQPAGTVYYRYSSDRVSAENAFFSALNSIDSTIDILTIEEMEGELNGIGQMAAGFRDTMIYAGLFSLLLAISGIYSLTSYAISRRTHEIGLRRALGAMNNQIVSLFVKESSSQLIIGIGIGVVFTGLIFLVVGRLLALPTAVYLFVYVTVIVVLLTAVLAAVIIPTRKAIQREPADALHFE